MNVGLATQTLSSVDTAIDFLWKEGNLTQFEREREATTDFIRKVDMAFDMLNSRHYFAKSFKAAFSLENLSMWIQQCEKLASYFLALKDEKGNFLRENKQQTVNWCFVFSIVSMKSITQELQTRPYLLSTLFFCTTSPKTT